MKNNKQQNLKENALRSYIRKEIHKLLEAENEEAPEQAPTEEPAEEEGLNRDLEGATRAFIRKVKDTPTSVDESDLVEMVSMVIEAFADSSERKLNILKAVKSNIVR